VSWLSERSGERDGYPPSGVPQAPVLTRKVPELPVSRPRH